MKKTMAAVKTGLREKRDNFAEVARTVERISTMPSVDKRLVRVSLSDISEMLMNFNPFKRFLGLQALCGNIEKLESLLRDSSFDFSPSEFKRSNKILGKMLTTFNEKDISDIVGDTNSIQVCMTVLNGDFSEYLKELAEKRINAIS